MHIFALFVAWVVSKDELLIFKLAGDINAFCWQWEVCHVNGSFSGSSLYKLNLSLAFGHQKAEEHVVP